jgi:16S rRNA pseudouridine516 synthase
MWREKKGAIFDMDGTLMDSMWMWKDIDIEYLNRFGIELPPDLQHKIEGMSLPETAVYFQKRFGIRDSVEKMESDWNQMAMEFYQTRVELKKGARELLDAMKARGMKLGIATSNSLPLTRAALCANGVEDMFDTVRSAAEVAHGKPSPDIYLSVAQEWEMRAEDLIVFEDIPMGALAGKRAGMEVVAVEDPWAASRREELKTIADYYIHDFTELI